MKPFSSVRRPTSSACDKGVPATWRPSRVKTWIVEGVALPAMTVPERPSMAPDVMPPEVREIVRIPPSPEAWSPRLAKDFGTVGEVSVLRIVPSLSISARSDMSASGSRALRSAHAEFAPRAKVDVVPPRFSASWPIPPSAVSVTVKLRLSCWARE